MSLYSKAQSIRPLALFRSQFLKICFFSCFINLSMLAVPLYMLQVYDRVLTSGSTDTLIMLTVLCVGLLFAMALMTMTRSWLLSRAGEALDKACNVPLFRMAFAPREEQSRTSPSERLRDLSVVRTFMTGPGLVAFFDIPWTPLFLAILFFVHPLFGLIAVVGAAIITVLALLNELTTRKTFGQAGQATQRSHALVESFARHADTIQAMGMLANVEKLWKANHDTAVGKQASGGDRAVVFTSLAKFVRMGLQVAVLGTGAWLAIQQTITPGAMIAASIIMGRALAPIEAAITNWKGCIMARGAYGRLKRSLGDARVILDERRTRLPAPEGRLVIENVKAHAEGREDPVLQDVSFSLEPGEVLGILGPSGAGKSTLARLLVGLAVPQSGRVTLDNVDIADWPKDEVGRYLGYMPQEVGLLSGTVAENISRFDLLDRSTEIEMLSEAIVDAAKFVGAQDLIVGLSDGYETEIGENGCLISGGQRQRIALARAVYGDTRLVILDEPNASLDGAGCAALADAIRRLKERGTTVVVISHTASIVGVLDKLLILQDGRVVSFGPRDQVITKRLAPVGKQANPEAPDNTLIEPEVDGGEHADDTAKEEAHA